MLGLAVGLKQFDNQHAATAAWTRYELCAVATSSSISGLSGFTAAASMSRSLGDRLGFGGAGQEPIVTDAVEAFGQDVERKRRMNSRGPSVMVL